MEAHIKGHANDIPDDDNGDEMAMDRAAGLQQQDTKHSILLNTPSTSSSTTPSPNNIAMSHPAVTKYETNESANQHLMNFAEQFSIINSVTPAPSTSITTVYPDTPKDSEASSEQNSDGDDVTYMNMYSRFEQSVVNQYGMTSGVNSALLAVASITASATLQPVAPTSNNNSSNNLCNNANNNLITLKPIQLAPSSSSSSAVPQIDYESAQMGLSRNGGYFGAATVQQGSDYKWVHSIRMEILYFIWNFCSIRPSNLVRCVEAALELTPPRSSPESPDRSSSPDSDSLLMADRDNNTLPPRKRKLYFKDNQPNAAAPKSQARISSVIQFAKAS